MKFVPYGTNKNEVDIIGKRLLFSYETLVALYDGEKYLVTNKRWSTTTQRHINSWLGYNNLTQKSEEVVHVDQEVLDSYMWRI